jgi:DNA processing protein
VAPDILLTDRQRRDWLRLIRAENVGPRSFHTLLRRFGSATAALEALPDLARRGGFRGSPRIPGTVEAEAELAKAEKHGIRYVAFGEGAYPPLLRQLSDAPPLIGVKGQAAVLSRPMVAIVGARNASAIGLKFAGLIAAELAARDYVVVSGLARGIDSAAHRATLTTGTIAVMAGGHLQVYPPEHVDLARAICEHGAVISEMPPDFVPRGQDFPRRNRIVAGLALGLVVVEAAQRSGSLITARLAAEAGREVFAAPGSPLDPRCKGSNGLIKSGATMIDSVEDVLAVLDPMRGAEGRPAHLATAPAEDWDDSDAPVPADLHARLVALLNEVPVTLDDLVRLTEATPGSLRAALLELELAGRVRETPGAGYSTPLGGGRVERFESVELEG